MAGKRITLQIKGNPTEGGDVKLTTFIDKLEAFKNALLHTERLISGSEKPTVSFRIVDASHKSPLTVTFEAFPIKPRNPLKKFNDLSQSTVENFFGNLHAIKSKGELRGKMDKPALDSYLKLGDKFGQEVFGLTIRNGGKKNKDIDIDNELITDIVELLGKEEIVFGSIMGRAEAFNAHDNSIFWVYPSAGPTRIVCRFSQNMQQKAKSALLKYVRVTGRMKYKPADKFPYEVEVGDIEELPDVKDLPTLMSLRGAIVEGTKEKSEDTIRQIRNANW